MSGQYDQFDDFLKLKPSMSDNLGYLDNPDASLNDLLGRQESRPGQDYSSKYTQSKHQSNINFFAQSNIDQMINYEQQSGQMNNNNISIDENNMENNQYRGSPIQQQQQQQQQQYLPNNKYNYEQHNSEIEIEQPNTETDLKDLENCLEIVEAKGSDFVKKNPKKSQIIDFLVECQDLIEETLTNNQKELKKIGTDRKINMKTTLQYAFSIKNTFTSETWPRVFNSSYMHTLNSFPSRKCPLPTILKDDNEKLHLESQNVFNIQSKYIIIEPAPQTYVFYTKFEGENKQYPIPSFYLVDNKTLFLNQQVYVDKLTTIQLIVIKDQCEESDLYTITISPDSIQPEELQRPNFVVDGSQRREQSWRGQPYVPNNPVPNDLMDNNYTGFFDEDE